MCKAAADDTAAHDLFQVDMTHSKLVYIHIHPYVTLLIHTHIQMCEAAADDIATAVGEEDEVALTAAIARADKAGLGPAHPIVQVCLVRRCVW